MLFGVPIVGGGGERLRSQLLLLQDKPKGHKFKYHVQYPDVSSVIKLIPYGSDLFVPEQNVTIEFSSNFESSYY